MNDRSGDDRSHTGEDISHEVVECNTLRGLFWHELGQHRGNHTKDQHGADSKEKVRDHLRMSS